MNVLDIKPGIAPPDDFNTVIEIPHDGPPVKYEVNEATGVIETDRLLATAMRYPCNYGFIPNTLAEAGDALDMMVLIRVPMSPGSCIHCLPLCFMGMSDGAGLPVHS